MSFKKINNITGWLICLIACSVYIMTMEATGSLWDCGEFASSAYKLQIPHPPGAPLFVLIGRIFMIPFDPQHAATGANLMSALASGFTILFLFWSITHFARKLIRKQEKELSNANIIAIMFAGAVGALAYTFSDSFWYSAVEAEVYALSSFFTAVVFWAMLKWDQAVEEEQEQGITGHFTRADRWIILIFYLMGLSIGVHLLNLLTIPALVVIYYYRRYKATNWGTFWAFLIGCIITGFVQKAVIVWTIQGAGKMDVLFVNSFGLPFFTGFAFFFILIAVLIFFGLRMAKNKNWNFLKLGLWGFVFMLLGYSTYFTTLIRSNADTTIDMYNVDNPVNLTGYLSREQYGDWPILYGQDFTAEIQEYDVKETYIKSGDRYEKNGRKTSYVYAPGDKHFFPRMWDQSNDQGHADYYANWAGIGKDQQGNYERKPTMAENIGFFASYQVNWMYWRYFMWNFAGKQNDIQGINMGNVRDGNWKTGIGFYDNLRLGDQSKLPDTLKNNKANNNLYALPLILGLLGVFYQIKKDGRDALVVGLLFFFTGLAIVLYLNQAGNQPRERDYAFVGSFYAFAFWIGLGVLSVREMLLPAVKNLRNAGFIAGAICLVLVPFIMAKEEWDDHDRSNKRLASDLAKDYLNSCAKNAIVISFGDNDTYPLWYAQEVEGVRPDIRVINSSLLGTDWYINQLRYKLNESDPIDPLWTAQQIEGPTRDAIINAPKPGVSAADFMDLYTLMKDWAGSDDPAKMEMSRGGDPLHVYPTRRVTVPVDVNLVKQNGTVNADDSVLSTIAFEIPKQVLYKNDAAILNIIAANKWKRPIYFTSPNIQLGFDNYLRQDGLTYRLVPVVNSEVNQPWVKDVMMNKFSFGNADKAGVYFDEENRRHLNSIRFAYANAAMNFAQTNRKEDAKQLLHKADKGMLPENFPYAMPSRNQQHNYFSYRFALAAYTAGDTTLGNKVADALIKDMQQQQVYYENLSETKRGNLINDEQANAELLRVVTGMKESFTNQPKTPEAGTIIQNQAADSNR
ncbi:MAG TPA: DUF2723 domain-containing protein [Ferruginibacter sp.]|nr:DUF2723 domain-containing protein [Ferruginibacter sp.]HRE62924.1 DUF2723 domain-containing protein [Ferruginibacter sp.]